MEMQEIWGSQNDPEERKKLENSHIAISIPTIKLQCLRQCSNGLVNDRQID